jgi:2-polyprenyl-3-methyl-5-hydroxy-6-metoxy-1,4-benzoquinol methylase
MEQMSEAVAFWDQIYENTPYSREINSRVQDALHSARNFFQPHPGQRILDIGCGAGATSIFWASTGAEVTAIDNSTAAINALCGRCHDMGIGNIHPVIGNAMNIDEFGQFDFVFGSMILHHLEPFREFAAALRRTLPANGRAFFYENNAASDLLIWFRDKVVGKLWVPKYGDKDEFPLTPQEIRVLRELFRVDVQYPEMMFFQLASTYLFKKHLSSEMKAVDDFLYKRKLGVKYSYRQYVLIEATRNTPSGTKANSVPR